MRVEEPASLLFGGLLCLSLLLGMVGGIGTLAVLIDGQHSRSATRLGFTCLFTFVGAGGSAFLSTFVAVRIFIPSDLRIYPFVAGYLLGGAAWFVLGLRCARFYERVIRPKRRPRPSLMEQLR